MRRIKKMCLSGVAVAAVLVVAMPASGASAAKLLVLSDAEGPVAGGSTALVVVNLSGGCSVWSEGTVTVNQAAKDKITGAVAAFNECVEGVSASGAITEAQLGGNGKYTLKGKISLSQPGPCVYTFSKWKGEFAIPGTVLFEEKFTEGKLNKKLSSKMGCAPTETKEYLAGVTTSEFELFEEALKV